MIIPRFFPVLAAFALAGCAGYHQGPIKPTPMAKVKSIAVPTFKNDTLETRVEVQLADSVIKQIQQDGTYRIADERSADAVLECTLEQIQRKPQRSVQGNTLLSKEYELILNVTYHVKDRVTGAELMRRSVKGQTTFFVSGSNALAADVLQDERQALPLAAEDVAIRLVAQISEGW
jgi:outer membrane lipopolysaccharide assembly protein LptE/RlpB